MNKKMHKLFVGLTALFILALVVAMLPQPVLAGEPVNCKLDGLVYTAEYSGDFVRETFEFYQAPLNGPGSTVVIEEHPEPNRGHIRVIIWVVLYHNQPTDEYTVRVINVVTGCNG